MSYESYNRGYDADEFTALFAEDQHLYNFADAYCRLFENLAVEQMLDKFRMIFKVAAMSQKRIAERKESPLVWQSISVRSNKSEICAFINILAERIYTNRTLAEHPEAVDLRRYLPKYLESDDDLFEMITNWRPAKSKKTIAFRFLNSKGIYGDQNQHILWLPVPEGLSPRQAVDDFKLLEKVCKDQRSSRHERRADR